MVPTADYNNLVNYYKGRITESALLKKAGRLAAERHLMLKNPHILDSVAVASSKPKAQEVQRLTKRIRMGGMTSSQQPDDDEDLLLTPLENKLDKILRALKKRSSNNHLHLWFHPPNEENSQKLPKNNPSSRNRPRRVRKADGYPP